MKKTIKLTPYECGMLKAQMQITITDEEKRVAKMKSINAFEDDIADSETVIEIFKSIINKIDKAEYKD